MTCTKSVEDYPSNPILQYVCKRIIETSKSTMEAYAKFYGGNREALPLGRLPDGLWSLWTMPAV